MQIPFATRLATAQVAKRLCVSNEATTPIRFKILTSSVDHPKQSIASDGKHCKGTLHCLFVLKKIVDRQ